MAGSRVEDEKERTGQRRADGEVLGGPGCVPPCYRRVGTRPVLCRVQDGAAPVGGSRHLVPFRGYTLYNLLIPDLFLPLLAYGLLFTLLYWTNHNARPGVRCDRTCEEVFWVRRNLIP